MNPEAIKALVMAAIAALIFAAGWTVEGWRKDAEIATLKRTQAEKAGKAADETTRQITAALHRADFIQGQLAAKENALQTLAQEKDHEIRRLTTGRRCLDGAAVRVLNRAASLKPAAVPEATSEPVRADAAFATDTDVGVWISQCQRGYDTCRGRLAAIADFYGEEE